MSASTLFWNWLKIRVRRTRPCSRSYALLYREKLINLDLSISTLFYGLFLDIYDPFHAIDLIPCLFYTLFSLF